MMAVNWLRISFAFLIFLNLAPNVRADMKPEELDRFYYRFYSNTKQKDIILALDCYIKENIDSLSENSILSSGKYS